MPGNLRSRRHRLERGETEGERLFDEPRNLEPPIREIVGGERLVALVIGRGGAIGPLRLADIRLAEFLGKRTVRREPPLHPVSQVIGRSPECRTVLSLSSPSSTLHPDSTKPVPPIAAR